MLIFQVVSGGQQCFIVRFYLAPDDAVTIERVVVAIIQRPHGGALMVAGNFNIELAAPEGISSREDIAASVATVGLEDMSAHFLPRHKYWARDGRTWSMCFQGR